MKEDIDPEPPIVAHAKTCLSCVYLGRYTTDKALDSHRIEIGPDCAEGQALWDQALRVPIAPESAPEPPFPRGSNTGDPIDVLCDQIAQAVLEVAGEPEWTEDDGGYVATWGPLSMIVDPNTYGEPDEPWVWNVCFDDSDLAADVHGYVASVEAGKAAAREAAPVYLAGMLRALVVDGAFPWQTIKTQTPGKFSVHGEVA